MKNSDIVEMLIHGQSLKTVMIPDPVFPNNRPKHLESYNLCNIIIRGEYFWGISPGGHFFVNPQNGETGNIHFGYSNINNIFFTAPSKADSAVFIDIRRYEEHNWNIKDDNELLWDWNAERDKSKLKSC